MVDFIRKRLQVFVSSTYTDLIAERQAAVEAILVHGHIPAGMELFTSGDESQMDTICQWIDESDVYLLILGGRYGSIEPKSGKSYTQLEYEYAVQKNKPLFACVIKDEALERKVKLQGSSVIEKSEQSKLTEFRAHVLTRLVKFWDDPKDIKLSIGETLAHFARREDLIGWVHASETGNMPVLADEIARLSKENAYLREQTSAYNSPEVLIQGLSFDELNDILKENNLLEFFQRTGYDLFSEFGYILYLIKDENQLKQLEQLGLIKYDRSEISNYKITEAGKIFINKSEVIRIRTSKSHLRADN